MKQCTRKLICGVIAEKIKFKGSGNKKVVDGGNVPDIEYENKKDENRWKVISNR
jgi:hypothetical protein